MLAPNPPPIAVGDGEAASAAPLYEQWGATPEEAASKLVDEHLTWEEKANLLHGYGGVGTVDWYVSQVRGIPRLGIPSTNMQDAGQGFRTVHSKQYGQVTSFPCQLAAAATWDVTLMYRYARAIGDEFNAKGANMILGPAVNVHRVARNGRNAEYLSGEDPALGAPMADAYVRGVQSAGVAAVVKHFVLNGQETNRGWESSDVSDRVLWEVYYPPFKAAVDAGVGCVMCGYNRYNGTYVCGGGGDGGGGGERAILHDLRGKMGFKGFVMTDWWALHQTEAAHYGVDQEQPMKLRNGAQGYFNHGALQWVNADVDAMARRVLTGMFMGGAWDARGGESGAARPRCTPGDDCSYLLYQSMARSDAHQALAREVAAASSVLLKNDGGVLPLRKGGGLKVALMGSACTSAFLGDWVNQWDAADIYTVGGSGRVGVSPSLASTILEGLQERKDAGDLSALNLYDFDWNPSEWVPGALRDNDVAIACGGTAAAEATDRRDLKLDQDAFLVEAATIARDARRSREHSVAPLIVVGIAPGAITADWADGADAAVLMFAPGQETGRAFTDVLFGDVNPSGRLPVTIPKREEDCVAPSWDERIPYSEGLAVGWRGLVNKEVRFPFGHGLSFTSFAHSWSRTPPARVAAPAAPSSAGGGGTATVLVTLRVTVTNTGERAGHEVLQLYLAYPESAGEPPLVLRGFRKTPLLAPGESANVAFGLDAEALSIWSGEDVGGFGGWQLVEGRFRVLLGASSRNHSLLHEFVVE